MDLSNLLDLQNYRQAPKGQTKLAHLVTVIATKEGTAQMTKDAKK
jgi:hypothetical protein